MELQTLPTGIQSLTTVSCSIAEAERHTLTALAQLKIAQQSILEAELPSMLLAITEARSMLDDANAAVTRAMVAGERLQMEVYEAAR